MRKQTSQTKKDLSRRGFIKTAAAAALGLVAWPLRPTGFHP